MIKEQDLLDAIAECQGERNPNASTCIKLAAYYTILDNMRPEPEDNGYSYSSGSEFSDLIRYRSTDEVMAIMDELMDAVRVVIPRLYDATMAKLRG